MRCGDMHTRIVGEDEGRTHMRDDSRDFRSCGDVYQRGVGTKERVRGWDGVYDYWFKMMGEYHCIRLEKAGRQYCISGYRDQVAGVQSLESCIHGNWAVRKIPFVSVFV